MNEAFNFQYAKEKEDQLLLSLIKVRCLQGLPDPSENEPGTDLTFFKLPSVFTPYPRVGPVSRLVAAQVTRL